MNNENATINRVFVGLESHGILTINLDLEFEHSHQGFGGYAMGKTTGFCAACLEGLLHTFGVEEINQLKGLVVRVRGGGMSKPVEAIGHPVKDKWFSFEETAKPFRGNNS